MSEYFSLTRCSLRTAAACGVFAVSVAAGLDNTGSNAVPGESGAVWNAKIVMGAKSTSGGPNGAADYSAATGKFVVDADGNIFCGAVTYVQMVSSSGVSRVLAGVPGLSGNADGPAAKALFSSIGDMALDRQGNLYLIDMTSFTVRKVEKRDGGWFVSTVAGVRGQSGHRDGPAAQALFMSPFDGIIVADDGPVYIMDGDWFRKLENGVVTTLSDGSGYVNGPLAKSKFRRAMGSMSCMAAGNSNTIYVADRWNMAIRQIDLSRGEVTTVAGCEPGVAWEGARNGPALQARFNPAGGPCGIGYSKKHDLLIIRPTDEDWFRIVEKGVMRTLTGFGNMKMLPGESAVIPAVYKGYLLTEDVHGNIYLGSGFASENFTGSGIVVKFTREDVK